MWENPRRPYPQTEPRSQPEKVGSHQQGLQQGSIDSMVRMEWDQLADSDELGRRPAGDDGDDEGQCAVGEAGGMLMLM